MDQTERKTTRTHIEDIQLAWQLLEYAETQASSKRPKQKDNSHFYDFTNTDNADLDVRKSRSHIQSN